MKDRFSGITLAAAVLSTVVFFCGISGAAAKEKETMPAEQIRESVIAGSWYPGDATSLRKLIRGFLDKVPDSPFKGQLVALVSPHAGYVYSGSVAAHAYKLLEKQKFESVIIIAPSHRAYFSGVSVYDRGGYRTPLGVVPLDQELVSALKQREKRIRYMPEAHSQEHSLEIQLPFLQVVMPDFKLVPLIMGEQSFATCQWLAEALADTIRDKSVLIVASSDLSHFHSYDQAKSLDKVVEDKVRRFDPEDLSKKLAEGQCEACGGGPIITAMLTARLLGANQSRVLHYANSGDVTGDRSRVVGYMAAAISKDSEPKAKKADNPSPKVGTDLKLTAEEKELLHRIARESIEAKFRHEKVRKDYELSPTLKEPRGAFVTLNKHGQLRGCIGHIIAHYPLAETISQMAVAAAFQDPRFPSVTEDELKDLDIEISVLTPLRKITDVGEIKVGEHGIYIKKGVYSGLLLPQVATEYGWDRNTFLEHTCMKAGLPSDAWKDGKAEIYIFSADIF